MRIGRVIGTVTLNGAHASLPTGALRVVVPLRLDNLTDQSTELGEELIVYDELGAGEGALIAISEGGEAAQPFRPKDCPIDAYNAAILDNVFLRPPKR